MVLKQMAFAGTSNLILLLMGRLPERIPVWLKQVKAGSGWAVTSILQKMGMFHCWSLRKKHADLNFYQLTLEVKCSNTYIPSFFFGGAFKHEKQEHLPWWWTCKADVGICYLSRGWTCPSTVKVRLHGGGLLEKKLDMQQVWRSLPGAMERDSRIVCSFCF